MIANQRAQDRRIEISAKEICTLLAERIDRLCDALGLDGQVVQGNRIPRNPTRHDRKPGSFVIAVAGQRQGRWDDFATGEYGDALDLVAYVQFGGWPISREAKAEAIRWSKRWLGLGDGGRISAADSEKLQRARAAMAEANRRAEAMALSDLEKNRRRAQAMFLEARPLEPGTPGWTYLREARGLPLERLARLPWAVRSHGGLKHVETDRVVPCLISAILEPSGSILAVHRVFLEPGGKGKLEEAVRRGFPVKKIWPKGWHGGFIPISRGRSGLSPKAALDAGLKDECAYWEGVENAFAGAILAPEWRVSAVAASANFAHVEPPECAGAVIVGRDHEKSRKVKTKVSEKVDGLRLKCEARGLNFFESWPTRGFKDLNDQLRGVMW